MGACCRQTSQDICTLDAMRDPANKRELQSLAEEDKTADIFLWSLSEICMCKHTHTYEHINLTYVYAPP